MSSILIVDDDESIRELLRMHLSSAGYEVSVAEDAIVAGYMVLRSPPDLIISDVNMPHMDGFEFVEALKADKSLPPIPVIFLTSVEEGDHRGKALGAVGYVTKPVRADKLLAQKTKFEQFFQDNRSYCATAGCPACGVASYDTKYFRITSACPTASTFVISATGGTPADASMTGIVYTINEGNAKATTITSGSTMAEAGYSGNTACWVAKKGGMC